MRYLKHTASGEVYPYNEFMALRGDMEEFEADAPAAKPAAKTGGRKKKDEAPAVEAEIDAELLDDLSNV